MMRASPGLLILPLILAACRFVGTGASPAITADYFFLGETYTEAGLVISACKPGAQRPPGSLQVRANLIPAGEWPGGEGISAAAPADYILTPIVIGVNGWGAAMDDAAGWRAMADGCYERLLPGAIAGQREWDAAGVCPVRSFTVRLAWGGQPVEKELPCDTPVPIVYPAEIPPPTVEGQ